MITSSFSRGAWTILGAMLVSLVPAWGQAGPDLVAPKLRDKVVVDATGVVDAQNSPVSLPSPLPNPFVAKEGEVVPDPITVSGKTAETPLTGADLLARLALQIPATGTVTIGGEPLLLLGQKRLKVGDTYTISFEGQSYDLSIAAVTPTSFTVKRGDILYSRPVRLSSTPTIRP
jgi:hypothetical protein